MSVGTHSGVKSHGMYEFFRQHPRILFTIPITVCHLRRGGVCTTRGISLDLGQGGMGAIVEGDVEVGETVEIEFRLQGQPMTTVAIVRHTSASRSGFEFVGLTPEERLQIATTVGQA